MSTDEELYDDLVHFGKIGMKWGQHQGSIPAANYADSNELKQSDLLSVGETVVATLAHFGVMGMKWGRRRDGSVKSVSYKEAHTTQEIHKNREYVKSENKSIGKLSKLGKAGQNQASVRSDKLRVSDEKRISSIMTTGQKYARVILVGSATGAGVGLAVATGGVPAVAAFGVGSAVALGAGLNPIRRNSKIYNPKIKQKFKLTSADKKTIASGKSIVKDVFGRSDQVVFTSKGATLKTPYGNVAKYSIPKKT